MKKNDLLKNTMLLSMGTLLTKGLQFIMVPFFTKWLSVDDYGTFDLICTYVVLLIPIITMSTSQSIFRYVLNNKEKEKNIITNGLYIYFFNIIIFIVFFIVTTLFFKANHAALFILLFVSQAINDYFQGVLRGLKKLNIYSFGMALTSICIATYSVIFISFLNMKLSGIILGYTLGYFTGDIFIFLTLKFWSLFKYNLFDMQCIKSMIKYSYTLIFNDVSWWIVNVSDRTIIKFFINTSANGIYAVANKIPALCTSVFAMFGISWQQTASEIINDYDKEKYYNSVYCISTCTIISLCICVVSMNYFLFKYIFPSDYFSAYYHTPILIASIIFNCNSQFLGGIQISLKNPKENSVSTMLSALVNLTINLAFINKIGLYAASISTLISNIFIVVFRKLRLKNKLTLKYNVETVMCFCTFTYFFISQYLFANSLIFSIVNFIFACFCFVLINRKFVLSIAKKIIKGF